MTLMKFRDEEPIAPQNHAVLMLTSNPVFSGGRMVTNSSLDGVKV